MGGVKIIKQDLKYFFSITFAYVYFCVPAQVNATCVWCPGSPGEGARTLRARVMGGCELSELRFSGKAASAVTY